MNKHFYRIIFNKARGMLMVVAEIVKSHQGYGRSSNKAVVSEPKKMLAKLTPVTFLTYIALGWVAVSLPASASTIIADKNAHKNQQPIITSTANGSTQINIQTPSKGGVSHNKYSQFDVSQKGVILNNSHKDSKTELAGYIKGNEFLQKTGGAKIILNEINSKNASQLNGYIEVAGQKAQVVIANAAGITCNGCGFINANRATLTTGSPIMENGQLTGYHVENGNIAINGKGMDSSRQDYTDLIARTVSINSSLWANNATVITGKNKVSHDLSQIEKLADNNDQHKPELAIDVAALGGMYAGKIQLIGTESGVGVHNAGKLGASAGSLVISADGKIVNSGSIQSNQNITLKSQQDIKNTKQIYSKQNIKLDSQKQISNEGSLVAQNNIDLNAQTIKSMQNSSLAAGIDSNGKLTSQGNITANAKDIALNGKNLAGNKLSILAKNSIDLDQSSTVADSLNIMGKTVSIQQAELQSDKVLVLDVLSKVDTSNSIINVKDGIAITTETLISNNSQLNSEQDISFNANQIEHNDADLNTNKSIVMQAESIHNTNSDLSAKGDITLDANQIIADNANFVSEKTLTFTSQELATKEASLQAKQDIYIQADDNYQADKVTIVAEKNLQIKSDNVTSNNANISALQSFNVDAKSLQNNHSVWLSDKGMTIKAEQISNKASLIKATGPINVTFSILDNDDAKLISTKSLELIGHSLSNQSAQLKANEQMVINANNIDNEDTIVITGDSLTVTADNINNKNAQWQIDGDINVTANNKFDNRNAKIVSKKNINVTTATLDNRTALLGSQQSVNIIAETLDNQHAQLISNKSINLTGTEISNQSAQLQAIENIQLDFDTINNDSASLETNNQLTITARELVNQNATLIAKNSINLNADQLNNSNAKIATDDKLVIHAGQMISDHSDAQAKNNIDINVAHQLNSDNSVWLTGQQLNITAQQIHAQQAELGAKDNITLVAENQHLDNSTLLSENAITIVADELSANKSQLKAQNQLSLKTQNDLSIEESQIVSNSGVKIEAKDIQASKSKVYSKDDIQIEAGRIINSHSTWLSDNGIYVKGKYLNNTQSTIQSHNDINLNIEQIDNKQSVIFADGILQIQSNNIDNTLAQIKANQIDIKTNSTLDNSKAKLISDGAINLQAQSMTNQDAVLSAQADISIESEILDNRDSISATGATLTISATDIDNSNSQLIADKTISLTANTLNNQQAQLSAKDSITVDVDVISGAQAHYITEKDLAITSEQLSLDKAKIETKGNTTVTAEYIDGQNMSMTTQGDIDITATTIDSSISEIKGLGHIVIGSNQIINSNSTWIADNAIRINADDFDNQDSIFKSNESIAIQAQNMNNQQAALISEGDILLDVDNLNNTLNQSQAKQSIIINSDNLTNTQSILIADKDVLITAQTLENQHAQIQAKQNIKLSATDLTNQHTKLIADKDIYLSAITIENQSVALKAGGDLSVNSQSLNNQQAILLAQQQLTINATDNFNNQQGQLSSQGDIMISSDNLDNNSATIIAEKNINISAKQLDNQQAQLSSKGNITIASDDIDNNSAIIVAEKNINISAKQLDNQQAQLKGGEDLTIEVAKQLNNQQAKMVSDGNIQIQAETWLNQNAILSAKQQVNLNADRLNNYKAIVVADKDIHIIANNMNNTEGTIQSQTQIGFDVVNTLNNQSATLFAGENGINISASQFGNQQASVITTGDMTISADSVDNTKADIVAEKNLTLEATQINNQQAEVKAKGDIKITATDLMNRQAEILSESDITFKAGSQINNNSVQITAKGKVDILANSGLNNQLAHISSNNGIFIDAGDLNNQSAELKTNGDLTIQTSNLDNRQALLTANNIDINAKDITNDSVNITANQNLSISGKDINNNQASLLANNINLSAKTLTGDGFIKTKNDLTLVLEQSFVNENEIAVNGHLSITSDNDIINENKITAGEKVTLISEQLINEESAEISANSIVIKNNILTNHGLIDGDNVLIKSGQLDNQTTGRIYADDLAIQATTLNNRGDANKAPIIAARNSFNLGVGTLNNYEHAQLLSLGDFNIGGALDENGQVTGSAEVINNHSATIEAQGNMTLSADEINNINDHIVTEEKLVNAIPEKIVYFQFEGSNKKYSADEVEFYIRGNGFITFNNIKIEGKNCSKGISIKSCYFSGELIPESFLKNKILRKMRLKGTGQTSKNFYYYEEDKTQYNTVVVDSDPAKITAANNLIIKGKTLNNQDSKIVAGKDLNIDVDNLNNQSQESLSRVTTQTTVWHHYYKSGSGGIFGSSGSYKVDTSRPKPTNEIIVNDLINNNILDHQVVNGTILQKDERSEISVDFSNNGTLIDHAINVDPSTTNDPNIDIQTTITSHDIEDVTTSNINLPNLDIGNIQVENELVDSDISFNDNGMPSNEIDIEITNNVNIDPNTQNNLDLATDEPNISAQDNHIDEVTTISTIEPNISLPDNSLFVIHKDTEKNYLIETDPRFTNKKQWLSSDYMIERLKSDPNNIQKRLGDGYYEQQLIKEQIISLTGQRYLADYQNDLEQYKTLMDAGITFAETYGLSIGVELSADLMNVLTSDIVWLVKKTVAVDGVDIEVLVPQVYVVNRPQLSTDGALLAGKNVTIYGKNINSNGLILAKDNINISGNDIKNQGTIYGDNLNISASHDILNSGKLIGDKLVSLTAGNDINLISTTHTEIQKHHGNASNITTNIDKVSTIQVNNGDISIQAGRDINSQAGLIINSSKEGITQLTAERDINFSTVETENKLDLIFNKNSYRKTDEKKVVGSEIIAINDISLNAGNDINAKTVDINAGKTLNLSAKNDITIDSSEEQFQLDEYHKVKSKGLLSSKTKITQYNTDDITQKGSGLSGDVVTIKAGNDLTVSGSQIIATQDVNLTAGNNANIDASEESYYSFNQTITKKSGLMGGGGLGFTIGKEKTDLKQTDTEKGYAGSTVGSTDGNVNIQAGKDLTVKGSDIIAKQDVTLKGENVVLESLDAQTTYKEEYKYEKSGLTVALTGTVADVYDAAKAVDRAKEQDNDKLLALQSIKAGLTAVQAIQDLQLENKEGESQASIGVSIMVGSQKTEREVNQEQHNVVGSGASAGNDITIIATGNDQKTDGDITIKGSEVRAGNDIDLDANRDLNVIADVNTQHSDKDEKSYGAAVGIQFQFGGDESGFRFKGNANFSHERENADGSAWSEGVISAGNDLTAKTGNNANIIGGQLEGEKVKLDIGNDLNIQSLQDTDNYDYEKISASVSATGGTGFSGNLSLSQTEIESNWASVTDQSGISTGKGGYDITVGNNTDLKGGVIASDAEDKALNKLDTGTISFTDIENKADFDVSHVSINIGTGGGLSPTAGMPTIYNNSGSDHSTTKSAVEDGELVIRNQDEQKQDINQLSRDTDNANNPLGQIFDKQKELDRMEALELVKDIASQAKDIAKKADRIEAQNQLNEKDIKGKAKNEYDSLTDLEKKQLSKSGINSADDYANKTYYQAVDDRVKDNQKKGNSHGGMGSSLSKGIDAATSIVTGIITGDITGGLAGASAPYLAGVIKEQTYERNDDGTKKVDENGNYIVNKEANLIAHAILGAAVAQAQGNSALAGGAGAAIGEKAAEIIIDTLYNGKDVKDLTESEKENISALAQLASGLAVAAGTGGDMGDTGTAVAGSKNAVENNSLANHIEKNKIKELANGNKEKEAQLLIASCALTKCSAGFPKGSEEYEYWSQIEAMGATEEYAQYRSQLDGTTGIDDYARQYMKEYGLTEKELQVKLFEYGEKEALRDAQSVFNKENGIDQRVGGVVQAIGGGVEVVVGLGTCKETAGAGCVIAATGVDNVVAGVSTTWTGNPTKTSGAALLESMGVPKEQSEIVYALMTAQVGMAGAVKANQIVTTTIKLENGQVVNVALNLDKNTLVVQNSNKIVNGSKNPTISNTEKVGHVADDVATIDSKLPSNSGSQAGSGATKVEADISTVGKVEAGKGTGQNLPEWISDISAPNNRHYFNNINQKTVKKDLNTVIDSSVDVAADMTAIKNGQASIKGNQITVNGRVYERKSNGTLYPTSGEGFTTLNRTEFSALGVYTKFGNTTQAEKILSNMKNMTPDAKIKALDVWKRNQK